jgi:hypothetical protein
MTAPSKHLPIETPDALGERRFTDATEAVAYLVELYDAATGFLREKFRDVVQDGGLPPRGTAPTIPRSASRRRPTARSTRASPSVTWRSPGPT